MINDPYGPPGHVPLGTPEKRSTCPSLGSKPSAAPSAKPLTASDVPCRVPAWSPPFLRVPHVLSQQRAIRLPLDRREPTEQVFLSTTFESSLVVRLDPASMAARYHRERAGMHMPRDTFLYNFGYRFGPFTAAWAWMPASESVDFLRNRASTSSARAVGLPISKENSAHPELVEGCSSRLSTVSSAGMTTHGNR